MAIEKSREDQKNESLKEETKSNQSKEMVPMSEVQALIDERLKEVGSANRDADLATVVAKAVAEAVGGQQTPEKFDELQYMSPRQMPEDDYLDQPVLFWCTGILLVIGDDRRRGHAVPTPYGSIVFKPQGEKRVARGREIDIQILGTYESWSRTEVKWLKEHSLMGTRFYLKEDRTIDMNVDLRYAQKVAAYASGMAGVHASQVISQATAMGIPVVDDVNQMRIAIAQKKATEDIGKWDEAQKISLSKNRKHELLKKTGA